MKVIVAYYSQSGNTKKIAEAINSELTNHESTIIDLSKEEALSLENLDLLFLGSPVHTGAYPKKFKNFLKTIPDNSPFKSVIFFTYGVPLEPFYQRYEKKIIKFAKKKALDVLGIYKCLGEHRALDILEKLDKKAADLAREKSKNHPNNEDIENAKKFTREILKKMN
ncbi:MAG: flavodoxin family protein [Candidatus Helarchaeota archaeon]